MNANGKQRRGFAAMSPEKQREIASKGGKAAHAQGKAHVFTKEEAAEAGRKGGNEVQRRRRAEFEKRQMKLPNVENAVHGPA